MCHMIFFVKIGYELSDDALSKEAIRKATKKTG
jgi:hypothetical protein